MLRLAVCFLAAYDPRRIYTFDQLRRLSAQLFDHERHEGAIALGSFFEKTQGIENLPPAVVHGGGGGSLLPVPFQEGSTDERLCYTCSQPGHLKKDCPMRKKNGSKREKGKKKQLWVETTLASGKKIKVNTMTGAVVEL